MATFPKNHETLYFDALVRTQKAESLLSMIQATYHAKQSAKQGDDVKVDIAKRLQYAYALFRNNVKGYDNGFGSYGGDVDQFSSQYTLGHEMAIWTNSNLDLNPLATRVAKNEITIRDYLDVVLLNYVQPIGGVCVHPLYQLLTYMVRYNKITVTKEEIAEALQAKSEGGSLNGLYNILISTNYFRENGKGEITYIGELPIEKLLSKCNITYIGVDGYEKAKSELNESTYSKYIIQEHKDTDENTDILNHNFFGMHITRRNSAVKNGEISIGWSALGDLSSVDTKEALSALFDATFPDKKPRSKAQDISQVWSFINGMAIDDYVVFSDGANAHIGVIRSDYFFEMNRDVRDEDYVNNRKVEWLKSIPRDKLPKVFRSALAATRSVFSLNNYKSIILELLEKDSLDYDDDDNDILVEADELEPEYTIDQLGAILRDMYDCCDSKVTGVHMFGLKYGAVIKKYGYAATSIVDSSGIGKSYHIEVSKGIGIYESILNDDFGVRFFTENDEGKEDNMEEQRPFIDLNFATNVDCDFDRNRIVFGAPGTGKSFQLEEDKDKIVQMGGGYERVTFHPDYTYSSFVGCYKPVSKHGKIEYEYVPGPFMRVLVEALRSGINDEKAKPYLLLIEEINRAKVAAVFGEVFQLLDRDNSGKSDYEIHASEDVKKYLADELNGSLDSFSRIRIPNNMFIWASMNSADQGVFPMDTAFKRRWSFEYKGIDENEDKVGGTITLGKGASAFEVNWNILRKAINTTLATKFGINEDKLMGPFFISEDVFAFGEDGKILNPERFIKVFKSKVIMYLYEDAAKQQKHKLFSGCDSTRYSSICDAFDDIGIDIFGADFKDTYNDLR